MISTRRISDTRVGDTLTTGPHRGDVISGVVQDDGQQRLVFWCERCDGLEGHAFPMDAPVTIERTPR